MMTGADPSCRRCQGSGVYYRLPHGANPFRMSIEIIAQNSRRYICDCAALQSEKTPCPPALARCVTPECEGTKLGARTFAEWNVYAAPSPSAQTVTADARFFIDHGMIHDRQTGKHVTTEPDSAFNDGILRCCELLNALAERREPKPFPLLFDNNWLEEKIKSDPDIDCEAGPDLLDPPPKWLDEKLRDLARELVTDPKTPWIGERDPKQHICWTAAERLATLTSSLAAADARGKRLEEALREIERWKNDTLGARPKEPHPYNCAPEITEAFDVGARMAFYRCADRASAALSQTEERL